MKPRFPKRPRFIASGRLCLWQNLRHFIQWRSFVIHTMVRIRKKYIIKNFSEQPFKFTSQLLNETSYFNNLAVNVQELNLGESHLTTLTNNYNKPERISGSERDTTVQTYVPFLKHRLLGLSGEWLVTSN